MPRKRFTQSSPQASQAWTMTSVSLLGVEDVAERLQLGDQLLEVVDLAVEDDARRVPSSLNSGCWPVARSMIDSRRWPKPDAGLDVQAAFVGAAMVLRFVHALQAPRDRCRACRGCRRCR